MKNTFSMTVLSGALAAAIGLSTGTAVAEGLPVTYNNEKCGTYTNIAFDKNGHLNLTGALTCLAGPGDGGDNGGGDGGDNGGGDNGGGDGGDNGGGDGGDNGGDNPACGPLPSNIVSLNNHPWDSLIAANARYPIALKPTEIYSFKINHDPKTIAYGGLSTINTTYPSATRTIVVSECPGSMEPVKSTSSRQPCKVVGSETQIKMSFDAAKPLGSTQCRLDPAKQYYINIAHQTDTAPKTCYTKECYFSYTFSMEALKR